MKKTIFFVCIIFLGSSVFLYGQEHTTCEIVKTDSEWKEILTPEQYRILIKKGTERAFTGKYTYMKKRGYYHCAGCGNLLFNSNTKFDSGTGWPSFWQVVSNDHVLLREDNSFGMKRTEVTCAKCGGHLGHIFPDGPKPTGLRFCINSAALSFVDQEQMKEKDVKK